MTMAVLSTTLMFGGFIALCFLAVRSLAHDSFLRKPASAVTPAEGAIAIARNRLLSGDIDRKDFERIIRVLSS